MNLHRELSKIVLKNRPDIPQEELKTIPVLSNLLPESLWMSFTPEFIGHILKGSTRGFLNPVFFMSEEMARLYPVGSDADETDTESICVEFGRRYFPNLSTGGFCVSVHEDNANIPLITYNTRTERCITTHVLDEIRDKCRQKDGILNQLCAIALLDQTPRGDQVRDGLQVIVQEHGIG